jgi:hypothetical protein
MSTRLWRQDSPGYIWQSTIRISTTTKYTLTSPCSHSGSTADGETGEEAESKSRRTDIPPQLERRCGADTATGEKTGE